MDYWRKFLSHDNFSLAWRRITTGYNVYYKRFFRDIYLSYEISLDANLENLIGRLRGGSYRPCRPDKIYIPKKSGLQRPITLLSIEDQIVWQAYANLLSIKWAEKRNSLEDRIVFSCLSNPNKMFFFEHWKPAYKKFIENVKTVYRSNNKWVAHFDLAAYFDTISHDHVIKLITPKATNSDIAQCVLELLECWTSERAAQTFSHGIPQGPIASSYIGELIFFDMDMAMLKAGNDFHYMRYVDDIRIFAKDEDNVRDGIVKLEQLCRNKGLIPQSQKTSVLCARNEDEAVGKDFSIGADEQQDQALEKILLKAVDANKSEILDLSKFVFFLYRSPAMPKHIDLILNLFNKYPHISDGFVAYLIKFENDSKVITYLTRLLETKYFPYQYVEGNIWLLLSIIDPSRKSKTLLPKAQRKIIRKDINFYLRYGLLMYLAPFVNGLSRRILNRYLFENSSVLQALILPTVSAFFSTENYNSLLSRCLIRTKPDAGLVGAARIAYDNLDMKKIKVPARKMRPTVKICLVGLGLGKSQTMTLPTPFQEIIHSRYGLDIVDWKPHIGGEYAHAHRILILAEKAFEINRSSWLCNTDSFNEIIVRAIIRLDTSIVQALIGTTGKKVKYGSLLDVNGNFSKKYGNLASIYREVHRRRCCVPEAHPYDERTATRAKPLKYGEGNYYYGKLKKAYFEVNAIFSRMP